MVTEIKERSKKVEIVFEKRTHEENNPFSRTAQMPLTLRGCNTKKIKKVVRIRNGILLFGPVKAGGSFKMYLNSIPISVSEMFYFLIFRIRTGGLFWFIHS